MTESPSGDQPAQANDQGSNERSESPENEPVETTSDQPDSPGDSPAETAPDQPEPAENGPAETIPDRPAPREPGGGRGPRPPESQRGVQAPSVGRRRNSPERGRDDGSSKEKMVRYLYWGAFGLLFLAGAAAAVGFYFSVMDLIDIWVAADFKPVFRMLFNLAVVLVTVLGLSVLVRRSDIVFESPEDG
jgi:hypothetical protein